MSELFAKPYKLAEVATALLSDFTSDAAAVIAAINGIEQTELKTDLMAVFETVVPDLLNFTADRRILLIISDGEHTIDSERQAILDAAATFKQGGGVIIVLGVRASGSGYDLLERLATSGYFINATAETAEDAIHGLNYLKSLLCAGDCAISGGDYQNLPELNFHEFTNFEVTQGKVNLLGPGLLDLLPGNGLYVEMAEGGEKGLLRSSSPIAIVAGRTYRVSLSAAGNQRALISGQGLKVFVREVDADSADPNVFEHTVFPDWDDGFQTFSFNFVPSSDASVRLNFEQIGTESSAAYGNLLDNVKFEEVSTLVMLLEDNFDSENSTFIAPSCGGNPALPAITDPDAPVVEQLSNGGDSRFQFYKYTYGYSWLTQEGETKITPVVFTPDDPEKSLAQRLITFGVAPERATGIRLWRSLGEGHTIIVAGSGTAAADGTYEKVSTEQWVKQGDSNYSLIYIEGDGYWHLYGPGVVVLYSCLEEDFPLGPWTVGSGDSPAPTVAINYEASATEAEMYLLASLEINSVSYIDSEGRDAFVARYDDSLNPPTVNTTAVAENDLGYDYDCGLYECTSSPPGVQISDPNPLPDIESGYTPPQQYTSTKTVCVECDDGQQNDSDENLIPVMTGNTTPSGEVIFSSAASGGYPFHAFNNGNGQWFTDNLVLTGWIGYKFTAGKIVARYSVKCFFVSSAPKDFTFEGSNDGLSWTVLDTRVNQMWYESEEKNFSFANGTSYQYYRLNISAPVAAESFSGNLMVDELKMFGSGSTQVCKTETRTSYVSQSDADALATAAARAAAEAELNCGQIFTATESFTAICPFNKYGQPVTKSATRTSHVSQADAQAQALAAAQAEAEAAIDCNGSNNSVRTVINDNTKATPYPSVKFVSGLGTSITKVVVTLTGLTHPSPDDIKILLVAPDGTTNCLLMNNCGGVPLDGGAISNVNLVLDQAAGSPLPDGVGIVSGTYQPAQYGASGGPGLLPTPAPQPVTYGATLNVFNGLNPNGSWSLWIIDDLSIFDGSLNSWNLTITAA